MHSGTREKDELLPHKRFDVSSERLYRPATARSLPAMRQGVHNAVPGRMRSL
jgi:hypothetical protein